MYEMIKAALEIPIPFNMIIICTALLLVPATIAVIAIEVRKFATHRMDLDIKREMIDQGMSVEEIERVIQAGGELTRSKKTKTRG